MDTVRQTCERRDDVGCDGEPVVPSEHEKHSHSPSEIDPSNVKVAKRRRRDDTADSVIREYVGLVLSVVSI